MPSSRPSAFTLIELTLVIVIIGILALFTLRMNRWQLNHLKAQSERESRFTRHRKYTTLSTNTNIVKLEDTTGIISPHKFEQQVFIYDHNNNKKEILQQIQTTQAQSPSNFATFTFHYHTISPSKFTITKKPLELGCEINPANTKLKLTNTNGTDYCFTLNTTLCSRQKADCIQ